MTVTIIPIHNHRWKLLICVDKLLVIPLQVQFYVFYNFFNENVIIFNHIDISVFFIPIKWKSYALWGFLAFLGQFFIVISKTYLMVNYLKILQNHIDKIKNNKIVNLTATCFHRFEKSINFFIILKFSILDCKKFCYRVLDFVFIIRLL